MKARTWVAKHTQPLMKERDKGFLCEFNKTQCL